MHCCLSLVYLRTLYTSVRVCRCVCSVMLPFPALGMFKASRCAVRMCLSLFSKNTCSAFYQWAALDWTGAVQGCAQITKHQQILIHPDWNWFGVFAELVWFGQSCWDKCIKCSGLALLGDWRLFVVRLNWSWYWISKDGDIPVRIGSVWIYRVSPSLSLFKLSFTTVEKVRLCIQYFLHLCVFTQSHVRVFICVW